jgi:hypothetical protein
LGNDLNPETVKDNVLKFVSSELGAHSANLIGMAIILFTYLTAVVNRYEKGSFKADFWNYFFPDWKGAVSYFIVFFIFWLINSGIIFATGRLIFDGVFARETIEIESSETTFKGLWDKVNEEIQKRKLWRRWILLWKSGIAHPSWGLLVSFALGLIATVLFFSALFF